MIEYLQSPNIQKLLFSILTILVAYVISLLINRIINKTVVDLKKRYTARKAVVYIVSALAIINIILIWLKEQTSIATLIGIGGAGLTLALHQPITSIAGWLLLLIRRPYDTGDRVQIGDMKGDVIDIRLFYTSLLEIGNWVGSDQSTGRLVHCPNGKIFTEDIFNYTRGFEYIWNEIKIIVTFESDWEKAKKIIQDTAIKDELDHGESVRERISHMAKKYLIYYEKLTPVVWANIVDFGVELTLRYMTDARKRRSSQDKICQIILQKFNQEPDVEFAYPTYRLFKRGE
ncbi:MAG TPA: mechanosensitive ion channel domain-containing protein [Acidobacteriota bacterium]|nr:mechanosensitive ion channel domain-containing protein [Acidobacteriota bacterium]